MDNLTAAVSYRFGPFRLDPRAGVLLRLDSKGRQTPVVLGSRAFAIAQLLVERAGSVVSKNEIMDRVWPKEAVEENNLTVQMSAVRRALDSDRTEASCIQTIPGRGYRFVPVATVVAGDAPLPQAGRTPDPGPAGPMEPAVVPGGAPPHRRGLRAYRLAVLLAGVALGVAGSLAIHPPGPWRQAAAPDRPVPYSPQDRRLSLIVLPFENSSADSAQDSLAAALTRDVTNHIAEDDSFPLVPAVTASAYQGKAADLLAIGRAHDVRFAFTGDVRRHEGHLLATVTLFDVTAGPRPIWAEHFNRSDTPGGRNGIVATVRSRFDEVATQAEVARAAREHPNDPDKRDLLLAAVAHPSGSREDTLAKLALLERVLALDRDYLWAILNYADGHVSLVLDGYSTDREADLAIAGRYVDRAFQLSPDNYAALRIRGKILRARRDWVGLSAILQSLLARNPIDALRRRELGMVQMIQGQPKDALESFLAAKEQGAERGNIRLIDSNIAQALLADGRYDEAIAQARVAMAQFQGDAGTNLEVVWLTLIAAEAWNGQVAQARADLQAFLAARRTYDRISAIPAGSLLGAQPRLLEGLRRAGMAEH